LRAFPWIFAPVKDRFILRYSSSLKLRRNQLRITGRNDEIAARSGFFRRLKFFKSLLTAKWIITVIKQVPLPIKISCLTRERNILTIKLKHLFVMGRK
jgi:hypothetical protein